MRKSLLLIGSVLTVLLLLTVFAGSAAADGGLIGSETLVITIDTSPSGAVATYDLTGERITTPGSFTLHGGTLYWGQPTTIVVTKNGYITDYIPVYSSDFSASSGAIRHYITLTPDTPTTGTVSFNSNPRGAAVYIDGSFYGTAPFTCTLTAGTHSVTFRMDGYEPWTSSVNVKGGATSTVSATMNKYVKTGYLSISSSPSGASVFVDNVYRGTAPVSLSVAEGSHKLELKLSGYSPYTSSVYVVGDKTSFVTASLLSDVQLGYISVKATPAGASMYVDGVFIGNAPSVTGLTAGPFTTNQAHTLLVSANGYKSGSTVFTLTAGETKTLVLSLQPEAVQTGTLYITSSPSNAAIYIDNIYYGMTPATIPGLSAGAHILKLQAQHYNDWQESVTITAGQTLDKSVSMSIAPVPTPVQTPAPVFGILAGLIGAGVLLLRRE